MSFFQALLTDGPAIYVSLAGSGTEDGLTAANSMPFADFLLETILPGTTVYFNRGDEFNVQDYDFSVVVNIRAYGSGADPIFTGAEDISGLVWTDEGGGLYSTPMVTDPKWIWISGICAKNAETARINVTARNNTTTATVANGTLDAYTSIIGAYISIKEKNFLSSQRATITNFVAATDIITFDSEIPTNLNIDLVVMNDVEFFSANNEWVWDGTKLWIKAAASPSTFDIKMANATYCIKTTARISVKDIEFKEYFTAAIWTDGGIPNVDDCYFHDIKDVGILVQRGVTGMSITDNLFERIGNNGIFYRPSTDSYILRNTLTDIGMQDNYNFQTWFDGDGSIVINNITIGGTGIGMAVDYDDDTIDGANVTVEYNTITNVASRGISFGLGTDNTIRFNIVTDFMNRYNDGGGIYTYHYRLYDLPNANNEIAYNIISNNNNQYNTFGIYLDNGSFASHVHHNTIDSCTYPTGSISNFSGGILVNRGTSDHTIEYNNLRGNDYGVTFRQHDPSGGYYVDDNVNNQFNFNNIASIREEQKALYFELDYSNPTWNPYSGTGGADFNHYAKVAGNLFVADSDNEGLDKDLAGLQAAYGQDANSVQYSHTTTLVKNPTNAISNENANGYYEDLDGNDLTTYNIDPYYSRLVGNIEYSNQLVAASSQYFNAGTAADIQYGANVDFSISFWFKYAANPGANQIIFSTLNSSSRGYNFLMQAANGKLRFNAISTLSTSLLAIDSTNDLADNTWHHVLMVKHASEASSKMYIDGADQTNIVTNNLTTTIASTEDLFIGARNGPTQFCDMHIDNVALWNVSMIGNQAAIYNSGRLFNYMNLQIGQPLHYWKMGLANDLLDIGTSASPLNLTGVNSPTSSTDTP